MSCEPIVSELTLRVVATCLQKNPAQNDEAAGLVKRQRAELQSRNAQLEAMQLKMNELQERLREAEAVKRGPESSAAERTHLAPRASPAAGVAVKPKNSPPPPPPNVTSPARGSPSASPPVSPRVLYGVKAYRTDAPTLRKMEEPRPGGNAAAAGSLRSGTVITPISRRKGRGQRAGSRDWHLMDDQQLGGCVVFGTRVRALMCVIVCVCACVS